MTMTNQLLGASAPLLSETNNNFVRYLTNIATPSHDGLDNASKIIRVGPSIDVNHSFYQYDDALLAYDGPVTVQGIFSNHANSPNGNWSTCGTYMFARAVPGGSRSLAFGLFGAKRIVLRCNALGALYPLTASGYVAFLEPSAESAPITSWQALKAVVRTIDKDTQVDIYRDFNVADALALSWTHCFTALIRQNLSVQAWQHEAGGFAVGTLNGETLPVWGGTCGWGAGDALSGTESANKFTYMADFTVRKGA